MRVKLFVGFIFFTASLHAQTFLPEQIETVWQLADNAYQSSSGFKAKLTFRNNTASWPETGWQIYFSLRYHGYALTSLNPSLTLSHVSGDLFVIQPGPLFKGLPEKNDLVLEYSGRGHVANYQDLPSGLFWVTTNSASVGVRMSNPSVIRDVNITSLGSTTAAEVFAENSRIMEVKEQDIIKIFPTPVSFKLHNGEFILNPEIDIKADEMFAGEASYLAGEIARLTGIRPPVNSSTATGKTITLKKMLSTAESYKLSVSKDKVVIEAADGAGAFYGIQSLKSLLPRDAWTVAHKRVHIPSVDVVDAPRFPFRSFMLDVGRNFQSKDEVLRILEVMSLYKLNVFHFHLNDDEGWRIEIPDLPELTAIGSNRGFPFSQDQQLHPSYGSGVDGRRSQGSGFYSKRDYVDILRFATERHIKVIPEIETPGHARAAIKAMDARYQKYKRLGNEVEATKYLLHEPADESKYMSNQYFNDNVMNVALPSTYRFVEKVIDELKFMYAEANAPFTLMHMAGDEVPDGTWSNSPVVRELMAKDPSITSTKDLWRQYFNSINTILHTRGLSLYGWEELVLGTQTTDKARSVINNPDFIRDKIQVDAWWNIFGNENVPYQMANMGYKVVLSFFDYFYFDLSYRKGFDEPGDGWVGFLDVEKTWSFIPYDYYRNDLTDLTGKSYPPGFFDKKVNLTPEGKKNIVGIQCALWGENLNDASLAEYQLLPKLFGMAERAWAPDPAWAIEKDSSKSRMLYNAAWSSFAHTIGMRELPKLDSYNGGYGYRIPSPGAIIESELVKVNVQWPGYVVRYTDDGSVPGINSRQYTRPIPATGKIMLRTFDTRGRGSNTVTVTTSPK